MSGHVTHAWQNPLATEDQKWVEDVAMRLLARPELLRARAMAAHLWHNVADYPCRHQMSRFENQIDEYVFNHALWAANCDTAAPRVARYQAPAHHWFGRDVPGSRWGGESPDAIYRTIPIAHGGRYEIRGRQTCAIAPFSLYSLMSDNTAMPETLGMLDGLEMEFAENGSFTITLDDTPAEGRRNHIQTRPGAQYLNIRDVLGDWCAQSPNALEVHRLDSPSGPPLREDEMARRAAKKLLDGVFFAYYCSRSGSNLAPNEVRSPSSSATTAGLTNQMGIKANFRLLDHEALIISTNGAGALFRNAVLHDLFSITLDYANRTSSFNMSQMAPDEDGGFTLVVAHEDPGVHNWLDTLGLNELIFGHRWQSFPKDESREAPRISARKVRFAELTAAIPKGVRAIDSAGRSQQIVRRQAGVARRFRDG